MMKCAVLLSVFSLPNQSKAFRKDTVFFLRPPFLTGMRENGWVPVRAQEQSVRSEARRGFQKHVVRFARSEHLQTWEKNQVRPEVVLVNSHDKSSAYQLHCGLFRLVCTNGLIVSDGTFQRISIKHSGFNPESVIEASFKVLDAVPDIMNKVQLFQERILTDAEQLALATGAAAYRWEDLTKAPVSPSMPLNQRRYGDGAKIAMQYFRLLPHPVKLRKEARWSGVSSVPGIGERVQSSGDVGTVTAYFVDNGRLGVLVRLELYPDKEGPDFHAPNYLPFPFVSPPGLAVV